jgi:hypothetical protein
MKVGAHSEKIRKRGRFGKGDADRMALPEVLTPRAETV